MNKATAKLVMTAYFERIREMGADNWAKCPKCISVACDERNELGKRLSHAYGDVTQVEYREMVTEFEKPISMKDTLGEYYDIGIVDGTFYVAYNARCSKCGFSFEFKESADALQDGRTHVVF